METTRSSAVPVVGVVLIGVTFTLAGCTSSGVESTSERTSETTVRPSESSPSPSVTAAPATPTDAPDSAVPTLETEASPDASSEAQTIAVATNAVTAFCRPMLDYQTWINELYPFLSQQAAVAYETVDPANVPCTAVTGDARVRDGDQAFTMRIWVPTDAGEYSVYVHRPTEAATWAVEQITPPDGQ